MNEYDVGSAPGDGPPAHPRRTPGALGAAGPPLVGPAAGADDAGLGSSSEYARSHRMLRPLPHDDYHAVVRARMADLDRLAPLPAGARAGEPVSIASSGGPPTGAASGLHGAAAGAPDDGAGAGRPASASVVGPPGTDAAPASPAASLGLLPDERLLVALDVDGTILDINGRVSERMMASLARLRTYGVQIVISTGRGIQAALPVAYHVGLTDGWMICANGAITLRMDPAAPGGYEIADAVTFDPADAIAALTRAVPDGIVAVEVLGDGFKVSRPFPDGELIEAQRVVGLKEMAAQPVTRVVLRAPGMDVGEFSDLVAGCGLHSVEYAIGWTAWLDVAPEGVTKASALQALAARLGTDASRTIAVGDGTNDVEMLRWAGVGAAMGSAPGSVKESSDIVTGPVWHDGCAALLDAVVERTRKRSQS